MPYASAIALSPISRFTCPIVLPAHAVLLDCTPEWEDEVVASFVLLLSEEDRATGISPHDPIPGK
jgi:hypothetical protein